MKTLLPTLIFCFCINLSSAQKSNVKAGFWSDPTIWKDNSIPMASDDVVLNFDITVDVNATCQSLVVNGHNIVVNSGVHLTIAGNDNSTTLLALIGIDTTLSAPLDTSAKVLFQYDSKKRNIGIDYYYYENGILTTNGSKSTFFYTQNDTMPYKREVTSRFLSPSDDDYFSDTCFYFYTNGILIVDSSRGYEGGSTYTLVRKHVYNSNNVITTSTEYNNFNPNGLITKDTVNIAYNNGSIIHQVDSSKLFAAYDFKYVYDNHPNPYSRTQSKLALNNNIPYFEVEAQLPDIGGKNNVLQIDEEIKVNFYERHDTFKYEYKANGYPKVFWTITDGVRQPFKGIYIYTD